MKKQDIKEMEKQHAAGYARIPSEASEFEEWEGEQVWLEDEEDKAEETITQTGRTDGGTKAMDEALERAAEIRSNLKDLNHSDINK